MTSSSGAQTYLKTRTAVMAGKLLDERAIEQLLSTSPQELCNAFSLDTAMLETQSPLTLSRATERALIQALMQELSILLRPLDGPSRTLLIYWCRKFELYNLKALIRGKLNGLSYDEIKDNLHDLPALISLPHEQLLRTENIGELLRKLEQTAYSDIARQARLVFEEKNEPFSLDATIDQRFYSGLIKRARSTEIEGRQSLLMLIGTLVDQQNLPWLLRYRFSYGLSATETYYLLAPFGRQLPADRLKKLVNLESIGQVVQTLPNGLADRVTSTTSIQDVEQVLLQVTRQFAEHSLQFSQSALTRSLAFMVLREIELRRIYAVVQGRLLNLKESIIRHAADLPREASHV